VEALLTEKTSWVIIAAIMEEGSPDTICCDVVGLASLLVGPDAFPSLRRQPCCPGREPLPPTFLKHADEQTVAGLAAVFQAIQHGGLTAVDFSLWAVIAAPSYLGRGHMAQAMHRFRLEGAWGVSPHIVPHFSLHAVSGTISLALKSRGPNFGVGGGPDSAAEAFTVAGSLLAADRLPGLWLVLTGYASDCIPPDPAGPDESCPCAPPCEAVALALVPASASKSRPRVRFRPDSGERDMHLSSAPPLTLSSLRMAAAGTEAPVGHWRLGMAGWVELTN
jgi:hypothetical protein